MVYKLIKVYFDDTWRYYAQDYHLKYPNVFKCYNVDIFHLKVTYVGTWNHIDN